MLRAIADRRLVPALRAMLAAPSPGRWAEALRHIEGAVSRAGAASLLRQAANHGDRKVRRTGGQLARRLLLGDVAPPFLISTTPPPRYRRNISDLERWQIEARQWGPLGWFFGSLWASRREPIPPLRRPPPRLLPALDPSAAARLLRPGAGPGAPYVTFPIPKATGGERPICAPRPALKQQQTRLLRALEAIAPHPACHGFTRQRSTVTNARVHAHAAVVVKTDISDFFPSIHFHRVAGLLRAVAQGDAALWARIATFRARGPDGKAAWPGVLPQGAPSSPILANLLCRRLDARLAGLARRLGGAYTRYADDLTFSFARRPEQGLGRFFWWVNAILQQEGFAENLRKRRVLGAHQQQRVTGVVVNEGPRLPREERRRFRAILENCRRHGVASQARGHKDFAAYLRGYAAYARMVQPELGQRWMDEVERLLRNEPTP